MGRKATGQVIERERKRGRTYALRFRAYGNRPVPHPWDSRGRLDLREGRGTPTAHACGCGARDLGAARARARDREARPEPTFHEFPSEWFEANKGEWRENTRLDYEWQLTHHLLPFFRAELPVRNNRGRG